MPDPVKAVIFDLGDTLIEYEGLPLSWEAHYSSALQSLAVSLDIPVNATQLTAACAVLRRYNTRLNHREHEVTFAAILADLLDHWNVPAAPHGEIPAATAFFAVFRQRLRCFPETKSVLQELKRRGVAAGVFTDVPYGMPRELVLEDVRETTLDGLFDAFLTSRDVGYRKPRVETITAVAAALNCSAGELIHVGNERKDIEVAAAFGCHSVLINRRGPKPDWGQQRTISSLLELVTDE